MLNRVLASAALLVAGSVAASSAPLVLPPMNPEAPIVRVADGCGPGFHRGPYGECVPNRRFYGAPGFVPPPPCPRGYYRDPNPARRLCYPYR